MFGANYIQDRSRRRQDVEDKTIAYRDMMSLHPHFEHKDQATIGRIYNSLYRASPHMAKDPMVAGAWVDNVLENKTPGMNSHQAILNAVKDLSGIEKNVTDSLRSRQQMAVPVGAHISAAIKDLASQADSALRNDVERQVADVNERFTKERVDLDLSKKDFETRRAMLDQWVKEKNLDWKERDLRAQERSGKRLGQLSSMIKDIRAGRAQQAAETPRPIDLGHFGAGAQAESLQKYPSIGGLQGFARRTSSRTSSDYHQPSPGAAWLHREGDVDFPGRSRSQDPSIPDTGWHRGRRKTSSAEPTLRDHLAALKV